MREKSEWEYQNERKLRESILYITADVFTFDLHVGCTEHTKVKISIMKYVCSCDRLYTMYTKLHMLDTKISSKLCDFRPLCCFCTRVHACMFLNTVLNKSILPSTYLIMNYYIVRNFKYTVHNDYRNKRSCTVHQSTNIQILKVFLSGMNKVTYFWNKYNSWQRKHAKLHFFFYFVI